MVEFDCYECNGTGRYNLKGTSITDAICYVCEGTGKIDWVDNIVPDIIIGNSLEKINIIRIVRYIQKTIEDKLKNCFLETTKNSEQIAKNIGISVLDDVQSRKGIYSYQVDSSINGKCIDLDIFIQPNFTTDHFRIYFRTG